MTEYGGPPPQIPLGPPFPKGEGMQKQTLKQVQGDKIAEIQEMLNQFRFLNQARIGVRAMVQDVRDMVQGDSLAAALGMPDQVRHDKDCSGR